MRSHSVFLGVGFWGTGGMSQGLRRFHVLKSIWFNPSLVLFNYYFVSSFKLGLVWSFRTVMLLIWGMPMDPAERVKLPNLHEFRWIRVWSSAWFWPLLPYQFVQPYMMNQLFITLVKVKYKSFSLLLWVGVDLIARFRGFGLKIMKYGNVGRPTN